MEVADGYSGWRREREGEGQLGSKHLDGKKKGFTSNSCLSLY